MLRHRSPEYYRLADEGNKRHFAVQSSTFARPAALLCTAVRRRHTLTLFSAKTFGKQSSETHCAPVLAHITCCKIRTLRCELWGARASPYGDSPPRAKNALQSVPRVSAFERIVSGGFERARASLTAVALLGLQLIGRCRESLIKMWLRKIRRLKCLLLTARRCETGFERT
ncbi:hypothetical protein ERJ75_000082500 [Trypanosoma vivax]|nr:hypothetical protein ERJ75_000082500 [Trypanosoma vivax]